jgi:hypothetical protein
MSVAFVREESAEAAQEVSLPLRAISAHPNLVTQSGLRGLEHALAEANRRSRLLRQLRTPTTAGALWNWPRVMSATSRNGSRARFHSLNRLTLS